MFPLLLDTKWKASLMVGCCVFTVGLVSPESFGFQVDKVHGILAEIVTGEWCWRPTEMRLLYKLMHKITWRIWGWLSRDSSLCCVAVKNKDLAEMWETNIDDTMWKFRACPLLNKTSKRPVPGKILEESQLSLPCNSLPKAEEGHLNFALGYKSRQFIEAV